MSMNPSSTHWLNHENWIWSNNNNKKWTTNSTMLKESNKFDKNLPIASINSIRNLCQCIILNCKWQPFVCDVVKPLHCWRERKKHQPVLNFHFKMLLIVAGNTIICVINYRYLKYSQQKIPCCEFLQNICSQRFFFIIAMALVSMFFSHLFLWCKKNSRFSSSFSSSFSYLSYGLFFFCSIPTSFLFIRVFYSLTYILSLSLTLIFTPFTLCPLRSIH